MIELLVVVAIISLLLAVLMPSLSRVKEQAKAVQCLAHLRELGHGMMIYYDEWGNYPAHQWRLEGPNGEDVRLRWFDAMASEVSMRDTRKYGPVKGGGALEIRSCSLTPD